MAAALTKIHRQYQCSLKYIWKESTKVFKSDPFLAPKDSSTPSTLAHQLHQRKKWCSRYPNPPNVYREVKEMEFVNSSPKSGLVMWYLGMVTNRPVVTKSITSALIFTSADITSQMMVGETYDLMRSVRMGGYGMLITGPTLHLWFNFVTKTLPKCDLFSTIKKMVLAQTVFGPVMTCTFFSVNAALQGESGSEIVARLKRDLLPTMINGIMYWPFCDFVTFKFVPVHLQPLVSNVFSYLWMVYFTYMANLAKVSTR